MLARFSNRSPVVVSIMSFFVMTVIVSAVGVLGTRYVIHYIEESVGQHDADHLEEVLDGIVPLLQEQLATAMGPDDVITQFDQLAWLAAGNGIRLFLLDEGGRILADSAPSLPPPAPRDVLQGRESTLVSEGDPLGLHWDGWLGRDMSDPPGHHVALRAIERVTDKVPAWRIGASNEMDTLADFMADLHWRLDAVLVSTFALIAVLGFMALRWVGRAYELRLEDRLAARTGELEAAHAKLIAQARLATIGETAAVLAHEMRNPLASITLALARLGELPVLDARDQRRMSLISSEVRRLESLLSETLDYVRPVAISEGPQDFKVLVLDVLQLANALCEEKQLILHVQMADALPLVRLDQKKMQQVLWNLLKNAIEASDVGGEIWLSLEAEPQALILTIANKGQVMDAASLQRAFELFYSTKPRGSGLGLGLVRRVVEEHGGTVSLHVTDDQLTCVKLTLPRM